MAPERESPQARPPSADDRGSSGGPFGFTIIIILGVALTLLGVDYVRMEVPANPTCGLHKTPAGVDNCLAKSELGHIIGTYPVPDLATARKQAEKEVAHRHTLGWWAIGVGSFTVLLGLIGIIATRRRQPIRPGRK